MRWWTAIVVSVLSVSACTPTSSPTTTSIAPDEVTTTVPAPTGGDPCLSGDLTFGTDGLIAALGESTSDATRITQIRWEDGVECERLIVNFATESGAPAATLGLTGVTVVAFAGLVRVDLPEELDASAVADMWTDGNVIDRTYVLRDTEGDLSIDIHAENGQAIEARAFVSSSPAALIIDVAPRHDLPVPAGSSISDTAVIVAPAPGPALYPLIVEAYVPPAELGAHVLIGNNDIIVTSLAVALAASTDTWQVFSTRIEDGPSGTSVVFVGQVDANDRPTEGAEVTVNLL